ncbi:MAG: sigma-70 family RNA polymerase sigma factor [Planctomycetota bacterium]
MSGNDLFEKKVPKTSVYERVVPNQADAADILQETAMLAWKKFDTFVPGSDFTAWAVAMARYKILKLRSARFDRRVKFDSTLIEGFDVVADASLDDIDLRSEIVQGCIRKLADRDANLIRLRYEKGMKTVEIAEMNNRPLQGLYKTMARIHRNLRECISRGLKQEAAQ